MSTRRNRGFYCRSYCLLNKLRAPLCPSSGAQEYYTVVAPCAISCCGFQVAGLGRRGGLCVRFAPHISGRSSLVPLFQSSSSSRKFSSIGLPPSLAISALILPSSFSRVCLLYFTDLKFSSSVT